MLQLYLKHKLLLLIKIDYGIKVLIFSIFHIFISFFNLRPLIFAHPTARKKGFFARL